MRLPSPRISSTPPHSDLQGLYIVAFRQVTSPLKPIKVLSLKYIFFKIMRRNSPQFDLPSYTCISSSVARKELLYMHFCNMIWYHFFARPNSVCFLWKKWFRQWHEHHIQFLAELLGGWKSLKLRKIHICVHNIERFFIYFSHPQYVRLNYRKAMYVLTSKSVFTQT